MTQVHCPTGSRMGLAVVPYGATEQRTYPSVFYVRKMDLWRATVLALFLLAVALGTGIGVMTGIGTLLHVVNPERHFDTFAALHDQLVVACLVGLSLLWVLPPHPWAKDLVDVAIRDDPAPTYPAPDTGKARVLAISVYQGRAPPRLGAAA